MKYLNIFVFAVALMFQTACNSQTQEGQAGASQEVQQPTITNHDVASFKEAVDGDVIVLDVRTPEEYAGGHLDGAQSVDIYGADFKKTLESLDKSKPYYVYCHSGGRSMQACEQMLSMGFTNVHNMEGGIRDWKKASYELVK